MTNQPKFDVFLAHNSKDKPEVRKIFEELKKCGLNPWFDEDAIPPGRSFQKEIQEIILKVESAAIFIGSEGLGDWQRAELKILMQQCIKKKIILIPVLLIDDEPNKLLNKEPFLQQFRWVQFSSKVDRKVALDLLVWGIRNEKPKSLHEEKKPGKIPKEKDFIDLTVQEIAEREGNIYLEALRMLQQMIDNVSKGIRDSNFNLFNEKSIFSPHQEDHELFVENTLEKIREKLLEEENLNKIRNKLLEKYPTREFKSKEEIITCHLIELLKIKDELSGNYAAGNILNLLLQLDLQTDFSYFDLSNISIWEADLRKAILIGVDFNKSDLKNSIFSEPLGCIHSIDFNADGSYFATGDAHGAIRVHNTDNLELLYFKNERGSQIWSVAFCPNPKHSQMLVWGAEDGSVSLSKIVAKSSSDKDNLIEIIYSSDEAARILSVAFSPNGDNLAFGGDGKKNAIKFFTNIHDRKKQLESFSFSSDVYCITFIDEKTIASGNKNGDIEIWSISNPDENSISTNIHQGVIRCIAFNSKKNIIATGGEDGKVILSPYLSIRENKQLSFEVENIIRQVRAVAFSQDGNILAVGCIDKNSEGQSEHKIRLWKLTDKTWNLIDNNLEDHEHLIRSVAFCPNRTDNSKPLKSDGDNKLSSSTDRISEDTINEPKLLISGGDGRTVKLWYRENENEEWKRKQTLEGYANRVWSVAFSRNKDGKDHTIFACGGEDNKIRIWNYPDASDIPIHTLRQHTDWVWSVAFNHNGTLIASGGEDNKVFLWELKAEEWHKFPEFTQPHNKRVRSVVFHPDKNILASAGNDNTIFLWDLDNDNIDASKIKKFGEHNDRILSLAFSPNGDYLASSDREAKIYLRDIKSDVTETVNLNSDETPNLNSDGKEKHSNDDNDHKDQVHSIAFSPKENTLLINKLVSGGFDQQLKLWDVSFGKLIHKHTWTVSQKILSVAVHPKEPIIASAGHGGFITLWNIINVEHDKWETKIFKILKGHKLAVESVAFSPDGKRLISCSQDQSIQYWDVHGDINISINTIELGNPYNGMNISGVNGLDEAQKDALEELGASRDRKILDVSN
ncbi:MAG: TIR domain-containing protein [Nostoc sp.]|uniref:TIR domain-containing protein n=1 Tax=Nostoc sp. TaxID=1180 RepID=UPI002FF77E9E